MRIRPGSRLLFIGDSVTDCGRDRPVGEGASAGLGCGYVAGVHAALMSAGARVSTANVGISGDTIRDLALRWPSDVTALRSDWLSVMIGINDVWRQFDGKDARAAVMPEEFARTYEKLVSGWAASLSGLVLMTPYFVDADRSVPMRIRMDEYGAIVRAVAARHGAIFVDTQAAFDEALARGNVGLLAPDHVHPTAEGHSVLARAFLAAVEAIPPPARP